MLSAILHPRLLYPTLLAMVWCLCSIISAFAQAPIAYYPFNGNASDESGNGHNGEVNGATLTTDRFGRARSAFLFDGDDFIMVPHSRDLTFRTDQEFTISAWIRTNCKIQDDYAGIVAKGSNTTSRSGYQVLVRRDSVAALEISKNDGDFATLYGRTSVIGPRWRFVTVAVSSPFGRVRIYVDGRLDAIMDYGINIISPDFRETERPLFIGTERNSSVFFKGAIDDVRIFDRMLGDDEILDLYHENGWSDENGANGLTTITACLNSPVVLSARDLQPPYTWSNGATTHSITVRAPGRYLVRANLGLGCPRVDTFDVILGSGLNVDAGQDTMRICRGASVPLVASVQQPGGTYTYRWTPDEGLASSSSATTTASPQRTTTYRLTVTDAAGCSGVDSVTVVVDTMPTGRAGADVEICAGAQTQLGRNPGQGEAFTYRWISGEGLAFTDIARPIVRPTTTGSYVLEISNDIGCTVLDTVIVTVRSAPRVDAGPDQRACIGESVRIGSNATGGNGPYKYSWSPITGLSSPTEATPLASFRGSVRYIVTVTDASGCTAFDTVVVEINPLPAGIAGADVTTCAGEEIEIGATPSSGEAYTYRWISGEGLLSTDVPRPRVRPTSSGEYVVEISTSTGCTTLDTVAVTVNALPRIEAGPDVEFCAGGSATIGSNASGGNGPYSYFWSPAAGLSSTSEAMPVASPTVSTLYTVTVTDANGCSAVDSVTVRMSTPPRIDAGPDRKICDNVSIRIGAEATGGVGPYRYSWTPSQGLSSTTEAMPLATPSVPTRYTVVVTDARGCSATTSVMVTPVVTTLAVANVPQGGVLWFEPPLNDSHEALCDSVTLRNLSDRALQIDVITLARNSHFSIPPGQIPFVIPPQSERRLAICYMPHTFFDQHDTLLLAADCGVTLPIAMRANVRSVDECNTPIAFRMLQKRSHFRVDAPYPNPANSEVTLRVERAFPSLQPVSAGPCSLYSIDGIEIASAVYTTQSGWSRDGVSYERGAFSFATDDLPSGIYYVRIRSGDEIVSHPVIISR